MAIFHAILWGVTSVRFLWSVLWHGRSSEVKLVHGKEPGKLTVCLWPSFKSMSPHFHFFVQMLHSILATGTPCYSNHMTNVLLKYWLNKLSEMLLKGDSEVAENVTALWKEDSVLLAGCTGTGKTCRGHVGNPHRCHPRPSYNILTSPQIPARK